MHKGSWDDLRFVLAVAESGSVNRAARVLGVNHATVLRRIAAFEEAQGAAVFDRTAQGYVILPDRLRVIEAARDAAQAIDAVARLMHGAGQKGPAPIRITSTDSFCLMLLPAVIADIRQSLPDLSVELLSSNAHLDLSRLSAEIAVRPAPKLPDELCGEEAGKLGFAVFAAPDGAATWLALKGSLARSIAASWMEENLPEGTVTGGADSFLVLRELAARGMGRAVLPSFVGDSDPRLVRVRAAMPPMSVPIWVASHADLSGARRLTVLRTRIAAAIRDRAAELAA